ncbi:hypothetical protein PIB30_086072 [Stylosanthes scabra]|uniref:Uncharacterized protein n=1 Tax=Stylosanthes scabra TaxID=79078 RepID=A0ABU6RTP2_9FABA|nr:hypothetical protein [Stylosanthes scabra]
MDGAILPAVVRGFPQRSEGSFHVGNASRPFNWGFVHEGKSRLFDLGAHGSQHSAPRGPDTDACPVVAMAPLLLMGVSVLLSGSRGAPIPGRNPLHPNDRFIHQA